jgi:iron complex outermembrane receptor protein
VTGDDQKLGLSRRPHRRSSIAYNELVTEPQGSRPAPTPFDYGNQQGASATAGFHQDPD